MDGSRDKPDDELPAQIGDYPVERLLGVGGMGEVYLIHDLEFDRDLALKILPAADAEIDEIESRFIAEGRLTGQLQHPVVPPVYRLCKPEAGRFFYTMKFIRGRTLGELLDAARDPESVDGRSWNRSRLLGLFVQICLGVAYAHSRGVIHRDIKPDNIMVGDYGEVHLMDWGLAKALGRPLGVAAGRLMPKPIRQAAGIDAEPPPAIADSQAPTLVRATPRRPRVPGGQDLPDSPAPAPVNRSVTEAEDDPGTAATVRRDPDSGPAGRRPPASSAATVIRSSGGAAAGRATPREPYRAGAGAIDPANPAANADEMATSSSRASRTSGHRTLDGQMLGTPQYMAPEQASGLPDEHDHRIDIYALGLLLWELTTGHPMRDSRVGVTETIALANTGWRPNWQALSRSLWLEPDLRETIWKATEPEPEARHSSAAQVAAEVQMFMDGRQRWRELERKDFSALPDNDQTPPGWLAVHGVWRVRDGALTVGADQPAVLHFNQPVMHGGRIELEGTLDGQGAGALGVVLAAPELPQREFRDDGYVFEFGARELTSHRLARNGVLIRTAAEPPAEAGQRYRLVAELDRDTLRLEVNGQEVLRQRDFFPLDGARLGLYSAGMGVRIERVRVLSAGVPRQLRCLAIPDHYAGRGKWAEAQQEYLRIVASHPGSPEAAEAQFKAGQCLLFQWDASKAAADANAPEAVAAREAWMIEAEFSFTALQDTPLGAWGAIGLAEHARRAGGDIAAQIHLLLKGLKECGGRPGSAMDGFGDLVMYAQVRAEAARAAGDFSATTALWRSLYETRSVERSVKLRAALNLASLANAQKQFAVAVQGYEQVMAEFRDWRWAAAEALFEIGQVWRYAGQPDQAMASWERVGQEYPEQRRFRLQAQQEIARLLADEGRSQEALARYRSLREAAAECCRSLAAETQRAIAGLLQTRQQFAEAEAAYQQVLAEYPDQPVSCAKSLRDLSLFYREQGNIPASTAALRRLMKEFPLQKTLF